MSSAIITISSTCPGEHKTKRAHVHGASSYWWQSKALESRGDNYGSMDRGYTVHQIYLLYIAHSRVQGPCVFLFSAPSSVSPVAIGTTRFYNLFGLQTEAIVQYNTARNNTMQLNTIRSNVQYNAVKYSTIQCNTKQHNTSSNILQQLHAFYSAAVIGRWYYRACARKKYSCVPASSWFEVRYTATKNSTLPTRHVGAFWTAWTDQERLIIVNPYVPSTRKSIKHTGTGTVILRIETNLSSREPRVSTPLMAHATSICRVRFSVLVVCFLMRQQQILVKKKIRCPTDSLFQYSSRSWRRTAVTSSVHRLSYSRWSEQ